MKTPQEIETISIHMAEIAYEDTEGKWTLDEVLLAHLVLDLIEDITEYRALLTLAMVRPGGVDPR